MDLTNNFHINPLTDDSWEEAAKDLPEEITITAEATKTRACLKTQKS